jgi:hypothetical protein
MMTTMKRPPSARTAWSFLWLAPAVLLAGSCQENARTAPEQNATSAALSSAAPTPRPSAAVRAADPALKQKLIALMSGYEHIVTKDELDRLGEPEALTAALLAVHADPEVHLAVRTNALANLRFYPSPTAKAALEGALLSPATPDVIRRSAVKAYGAGFGQEAVDVLAKMLEHEELHTRNLAAKTLLQIGGQRATETLRHRLPNEREALVKSTIEAGLRQP